MIVRRYIKIAVRYLALLALALAAAGCSSKENEALKTFKTSSTGKKLAECVGVNGTIDWSISNPGNSSNKDVRVIEADMQKNSKKFVVQYQVNLKTGITELSYLSTDGKPTSLFNGSIELLDFCTASSISAVQPTGGYDVKSVLTEISEAMDPPKTAIAFYAQETNSVTFKTEDDWKDLGFSKTPVVPPGVSSIALSKVGVVTINIAPRVLADPACSISYIPLVERSGTEIKDIKYQITTTCPEPAKSNILNSIH